MTKIIIGIIIVVMLLGCTEKICNGNEREGCSKKCNVDADCNKAENCACYNKKDADKLSYGKDGRILMFEQCEVKWSCKCMENTCKEIIENEN